MKDNPNPEAELSKKLGYQFTQPHLLIRALTHRSSGHENNERLEFFGDSVVNFIITEALLDYFPYAQEGELSRLRAKLVNREALGLLAREFEVGRYLHLGLGELRSGGKERLSILSCAMEAIIGAIYLDGGFLIARDIILRWYQPLLKQLTKSSHAKDPKTELQEYLQYSHLPLPVYNVLSIEGEAHQQLFIVSCEVQEKKVIAKGSSRRRAEQEAAENMLKVIKK